MADNSAPVSKAKRDTTVVPTLVSYFGEKPVAAAAFVKAVRSARITRFTDSDVQDSIALMAVHDADCRRLLTLASQPDKPEALEGWLWPTVQTRLKDLVPGEFDPFEGSAHAVLRSILRQLSGLLGSNVPEKRRKAETTFLLGLKWLVSQRGLDTKDAIDGTRLALSSEKDLHLKALQRFFAQGKISDFRNVATIASLTGEAGREAQRALEAETLRLIDIRAALNATASENADLRLTLEAMKKERDDFSARLEQAEKRHENDQQHWGHTLSNLEANHEVLLRQRIGPLIDQAIDAIEITPIYTDVAISRLKSVKSIIKDSVK